MSPRGSLALLRAARARALADGRDYLLPDDIKELAAPGAGPPGDRQAAVTARRERHGRDAAIAAILQDSPVPR